MRTLLLVLLVLVVWTSPCLSGIAGLTKFFRQQFSGSWTKPIATKTQLDMDGKEAPPIQVENLCVDMNQVLHSGLKLAVNGNMKTFASKIYTDLDNLLKIVEPTKALVLAFDGPAPFAKMQTQRNRRNSSPENSIITPGTDFMNSIDDIMVCYVVQRLRRDVFRNLTVFISGPSCPGEGEVKIVEWVNNHMHGGDSLVISGSDSDILLQGLAIANRPHRKRDGKTLVLQSTSSGRRDRTGHISSFCDMDLLVEGLQKYTGITPSKAQKSILRNQARHNVSSGEGGVGTRDDNGGGVATGKVPNSFNLDMIVLFILQGNDYLPKMRGVTVPRTAGAYGRAMARLPKKQQSLLDLEHNSFNFLALWTVMDELGPWTAPSPASSARSECEADEPDSHEGPGQWKKSGKSDKPAMPLPVTLPTSLQSFHTYLQRRKSRTSDSSAQRRASSGVAADWQDYSNDRQYNRDKELLVPSGEVVTTTGRVGMLYFAAGDGNVVHKPPRSHSYKLWGTSIEVDGVVFAVDPVYSNKKVARQVVSAIALQTLDREMYADMLVRREAARSKLQYMRREVMREESAFCDKYFPGILEKGAMRELEEEDERGLEDGGTAVNLADEGLDDGDTEEEGDDLVEIGEGSGTEGLGVWEDACEEDALYVSEEEYSRFVTDTDIEAYLQGILWVVQMYVEGVCPDLSFTFVNRPPASPACIQKYIEKKYLQARVEDLAERGKQFDPFFRATGSDGKRKGRNRWANKKFRGHNGAVAPGNWTQVVSGVGDLLDQVDPRDLHHPSLGLLPGSRAHTLLRQCLHTPHSHAKPMSASGACVCVVPEVGKRYVPDRLRGMWTAMQVKYFQRFGEDRLMETSYEEVGDAMSAIFETANVIADVTAGVKHDEDGKHEDPTVTSSNTEDDSDGTTGPSVDTRKAVSTNSSVTTGDEHSFWTVITRGSAHTMKQHGYRAEFAPHFHTLSHFSASVPFNMPRKMPFGHRILITGHQIVSKKTKFKKFSASLSGGQGGGNSKRRSNASTRNGASGADDKEREKKKRRRRRRKPTKLNESTLEHDNGSSLEHGNESTLEHGNGSSLEHGNGSTLEHKNVSQAHEA